MPRTKTIPARDRPKEFDNLPNFSVTGSIKGMKKLYYGRDALLVRCGSYIFDCTSVPDIYNNIAH